MSDSTSAVRRICEKKEKEKAAHDDDDVCVCTEKDAALGGSAIIETDQTTAADYDHYDRQTCMSSIETSLACFSYSGMFSSKHSRATSRKLLWEEEKTVIGEAF